MELHTYDGTTFLIDDEDFEKVKPFSWSTKRDKNTIYVRANIYSDGGHEFISLHRLIINAPNGIEVDHIDGNGLNNTKANLRLCSHRQNLYNGRVASNSKSGFKGVSWHSQKKRWRVYIRADGKRRFVGQFRTKKEAALAYNEQAKLLHGEFARLNIL